MLEKIKKEIKKTFYIDEDDMHFEEANINIDSLFEILDKYKDKECKYKNAWKNLKRQGFNRSSDIVAHEYLKDMQELEQKYNLDGEQYELWLYTND